MYKRWQLEKINHVRSFNRIVLLVGPRQCGKTTLSKSLLTKDSIYRNLDDSKLRISAKNDPQSFVEHEGDIMIIDEIQRVPELVLSVKEAVDDYNKPGRYLLTGSADIQSLSTTQESLAGRVSKIRLRGLSQGEIEGSAPDFLKQAFWSKFARKYEGCNQKNVISRAVRGNFPATQELLFRDRRRWYIDYITALLSRDLKDVANIRKHQSMWEMIRVLSAWSGKFMDISKISASLSLQRATIYNYIHALEMLYICESCPAWTKTDYEYLHKSSKIYMSDYGMIPSILSWKEDQIALNADALGKLVETFIFNEIRCHIDSQEETYELYHYRDKLKREIDFLIENEEGDLLGIEVKAGSSISKNQFKHLQWFKENLQSEKRFIGICLYTGEDTLSFGKDMWAVPMAALWSPQE